MPAFVIDAPESNGAAFRVIRTDSIVPLQGGGFALLQREMQNLSILGTRLVQFAPDGDGFASVGSPVGIGDAPSAPQSLVALIGGGLAVHLRQTAGAAPGLRILTFDNTGAATGEAFTAGLFDPVLLDLRDSGTIPRPFVGFRPDAGAPRELREISLDTGALGSRVRPHPGVDLVAGIDGGFVLSVNDGFDALLGAPVLRRAGGAAPVWSLGPVDADGFFTGDNITAGNHLVVSRIDGRFVSDGSGGNVLERTLTIAVVSPDGAPQTVLTETRRDAGFAVKLTEVPGFGFAAFIVQSETRNSTVVSAEVLLFDFAGTLVDREAIAGPLGITSLGREIRILALGDPSEASVRILAVWEEDEDRADTTPERTMGELVTFAIPAGEDGRAVVAAGTALGDVLRGFALADHLDGGAGADDLLGHAGNDTLIGGEGNDAAFGGDGDDRVEGGAGKDFIFGEAGDDTLSGGDGADTLTGGDGRNRLDGGNGEDLLIGGDGDDALEGGRGKDRLFGNGGADQLSGGDGDDVLSGGEGGGFLSGGRGNDRLVGGSGVDAMGGGPGNDTLRGGGEVDFMNGDEGVDVLFGDDGDDDLKGASGNDTLDGGSGDDILDGGTGRDVLSGGQDDDRLIGGLGPDRMTGGAGADVFVWLTADDSGIRRARDVITDFAPGVDRIDLRDIAPDIRFAGTFSPDAPTIVYRAATGLLLVDFDADARADFEILLENRPSLPTGSFLL